MPVRPQDAIPFRDLHQDFLVLANVWDAASAALVARAGARAIATSSAALAWAHGYPDGHGLSPARLAASLEEIARVIALPITVDAEGGYADDPANVGEVIAALIDAGAVGINLEDGRALHELHLRKLEAALAAAQRLGVDLFVNARTDVFLKELAPAGELVAETIRRGQALKSAGAHGFFVPGVFKPEDIKAIAEAVALPLNVMARPGLPDRETLKALGVRRLSAATALFHAAAAAVREAAAGFLDSGDSAALAARGGERVDYNALFAR